MKSLESALLTLRYLAIKGRIFPGSYFYSFKLPLSSFAPHFYFLKTTASTKSNTGMKQFQVNLENGPGPIAFCGHVMALIVVLFDSHFLVTESLFSFHYDLFFPSSLLYSGVHLVGTSSLFVSHSLSLQKSMVKLIY